MDGSIQAGPSCRPKKQSYKKQKRSVDGSFLGRFEVVHVFGKVIGVMCSKEIAEESLKPNKLLKHMQWRTQKIFMVGFIQWHMVVICIWCALFVTSQLDVIFVFSSEVC